MPAQLNIYNSWALNVGRQVDLDTSLTVNVSLHTSSYTPNQDTHAVFADVTNQLSTANGYTSGGQALGSMTWTRSSAIATFDAADTVWTASGGSIVARFAVIRVVGTLDTLVDPLIAWVLLDDTPADVTTTSGNTLTLQWNASGIFRITRS
jgi:hypothetical protein